MNETNPTYFAARNGYQGFTSYFEKIFSPVQFSKIYILKGGPGTGKSTLMKKVRDAFKESGVKTQSILCSSDPASLDGLILEENGRKIAVLDGTAPHATDPSLPVAIEEIIDLGSAIFSQHISPYRAELSHLLEKKKFSYKLAYHFLLVCGELDRNYRAVVVSKGYANEKADLKSLFDGICFCSQGKESIRLYNAFSKDGLTELPCPFLVNSKVIKITNQPEVMQSLYNFIQKQKKEFIVVPDALCGVPRYLYLPDVKITVTHENSPTFSSEMQHIYDESLLLSKSHFEDAAKYHFKMEDIYREALCFDQLNEITTDLIKKITVLFSLS